MFISMYFQSTKLIKTGKGCNAPDQRQLGLFPGNIATEAWENHVGPRNVMLVLGVFRQGNFLGYFGAARK